MTVSEAIERLQDLQRAGLGNAKIRSYSELSPEVYPPIKMAVHYDEDNDFLWDQSYGDWVEIL